MKQRMEELLHADYVNKPPSQGLDEIIPFYGVLSSTNRMFTIVWYM